VRQLVIKSVQYISEIPLFDTSMMEVGGGLYILVILLSGEGVRAIVGWQTG